MSDLPLNSVENTRENTPQSIDGNSNLTKSPYKLSMTEKRVIGGLQKLTDLLFKQYYKDSQDDEENQNQVDGTLQSNEVTTSTQYAASSTNNVHVYTNKENDENFEQFVDNGIHNGAEQFCAMVVHKLAGDGVVQRAEEWHRDQLDAYNQAQKHFFG